MAVDRAYVEGKGIDPENNILVVVYEGGFRDIFIPDNPVCTDITLRVKNLTRNRNPEIPFSKIATPVTFRIENRWNKYMPENINEEIRIEGIHVLERGEVIHGDDVLKYSSFHPEFGDPLLIEKSDGTLVPGNFLDYCDEGFMLTGEDLYKIPAGKIMNITLLEERKN